MLKDVERNEFYFYNDAKRGWIEVFVLDYDDHCVFVELVENRSHYRKAIIKRKVFEERFNRFKMG